MYLTLFSMLCLRLLLAFLGDRLGVNEDLAGPSEWSSVSGLFIYPPVRVIIPPVTSYLSPTPKGLRIFNRNNISPHQSPMIK